MKELHHLTFEDKTMDIYIETTRVLGSDGMARHYFAEPHFTIDEKDTITADTMRVVCDRVRDTLNECFRAAETEKGGKQ